MLISISGAGGAGKTTTINALQEQGFKAISRKTSRSILSDWGQTLDEINSSPDLATAFQKEILIRKVADDKVAEDGSIWFTERSPVDLATYSTITLGQFNDFSDFVNQYYNDCIDALRMYDYVMYIESGHFRPVHDGVRGSNVHYARLVDLVMRDNLIAMCGEAGVPIKFITEPTIEGRVQQILNVVTRQARSS